MRFACWITKATVTSSVFFILISFPRQHWLCERTSMPHCTYIACLVMYTLSLSDCAFLGVSCCELTSAGGDSYCRSCGM
jgi:hypothetical protein